MEEQIRPQPGFQMDFLRNKADIIIGGGAAGAGKTLALLIEPLRHMGKKGFGGTILRRTYPQIRNKGGLWDASKQLYPHCGLKANETYLSWENELGCRINFAHLQHLKNVYDYQGSEIPYIGFDELTHFTEEMFFYLLTRNRTTCGVKPYIRATCNPDPDSWVKRLIQWWIDEKTGFPIVERAGVIRYFTKDNGKLVWGDTADEVINACPHIFNNPELKGMDARSLVKSITFIPGSIYGNKKLLQANPEYLGALIGQDETTRSQLLEGNWNVKADPLSIYELGGIESLFSNTFVKPGRKYITVDAARFGSDLCFVYVWSDRRLIAVKHFPLSSTTDIANCVKQFEKEFAVMRSNTICDADGVGGGVVDQCQGMVAFHNGAKAIQVKGQSQDFDMLKTQCFYKSADMVNSGKIYVEETVQAYEVEGRAFREVLSKQLRAIKKPTLVSADGKKKLITKEQVRNILGCSPDAADTFMLREYFELRGVGGAPRATMSTRR